MGQETCIEYEDMLMNKFNGSGNLFTTVCIKGDVILFD